MNIDIESIIQQQIKPLLDKITTLELVVTVLANKLNDAECRKALEQFCHSKEPIIEVERDEVKQKPLIRSKVKGNTRDYLIDYFSKLDPDFKTGKTTYQVRDETGLSYGGIYACLRDSPEHFINKQGTWFLRTEPI